MAFAGMVRAILLVSIILLALFIASISALLSFVPSLLKLLGLLDSHVGPSLRIRLDSLLRIVITDLELGPEAMRLINAYFYSNAQFQRLTIGKLQLQLFPLIVQVDHVLVQIYCQDPASWPLDVWVERFRSMRSSTLNKLTQKISARLTHAPDKNAALVAVGLFVDPIIASASVRITDIKMQFCTRKLNERTDTALSVCVDTLRATPAGTLSERLFSTSFAYFASLDKISVTSILLKTQEQLCAPLLEPVVVEGKLTLPKILGYMIQEAPLNEKRGILELKLDTLYVNAFDANVFGLVDFSCCVAFFKQWYRDVECIFEDSLGRVCHQQPKELIATYIALYSLCLHGNTAVKRQNEATLHRMEERMTSGAIMMGRALAHGWFQVTTEDEDGHSRVVFTSNGSKVSNLEFSEDSHFQEAVIGLLDMEKSNCQELRNMTIYIKLRSCQFRLGTTHENITPITLEGMNLEVIEPIVKPTQDFDVNRVIKGTLRRLQIGNPPSKSDMFDFIFDRGLLFYDKMQTSEGNISNHLVQTRQKLQLLETDRDVELDEMVTFSIIEKEYQQEIYVEASLIDAIIMPEAKSIMRVVEYLLSVVVELANRIKFWLDESTVREVTHPKVDTMPGSIFHGAKLDVKVKAQRLCLCFAEEPIDGDAYALSLQVAADLNLTSYHTGESLLCSINDVGLLPCVLLAPTTANEGGTRIQVQDGVAFMEPMGMELAYRLKHEIDLGEFQRVVSLQCQQIIVNVSEFESRVLMSWARRFINDLLTAIDVIMKGQNTKNYFEEARRRIRLEEEKSMLITAFQAHDSNGDGTLQKDEVQAMFSDILKPLQLTASELEEEIVDLIALLDRDLDGQIRLEEVQDIWLQSDDRSEKSLRGNCQLAVCEYDGAGVSSLFVQACTPSEAQHAAQMEVWRILEEETGVKSTGMTLQTLQPKSYQRRLVRLCKDWKLAKQIWEEVVRLRFTDEVLRYYPWILELHQEAGGKLHAEELATKLFQKTYGTEIVQENKQYYIPVETDVNLFLQKVQLNLVDSLLGPAQPRFQVQVDEISLVASARMEGPLCFDLSPTSSDSITGNLCLGASAKYYNSLVRQYEPLLENWVLKGSLVKANESCLKCHLGADLMSINVSTALIQTGFILFELLVPVAKIGMNIQEDVSGADTMSFDRHVSLSRTSIRDAVMIDKDGNLTDLDNNEDNSQSKSDGRYPAFIFKNETGAQTRLHVALPRSKVFQTDGEETSVIAAFVEDGMQHPVVLDWSYNIYEEHNNNLAPPLLSVSTVFSDLPNFHRYGIPLHMLPAHAMVSMLNRPNDDPKTSPAMVLELRTGAGESKQDHGSILRARSNVSVTNRSGQDVLLKLCARNKLSTSGDDELHEIQYQLTTLEIRSLPLDKLLSPFLSLSLYDFDAKAWTPEMDLQRLIGQKSSEHLRFGPFFVLVHSTPLPVDGHVTVRDHHIDIISGLRIVNCLPYVLELIVHMVSEVVEVKQAHKYIHRIRSGEEHLLKMDVYGTEPPTMRMRIIQADAVGTDVQWSEMISLERMFDTNQKKELLQKLPCSFMPPHYNVRANVMMSRDMSKDDPLSPYASVPSVVVYTDVWLQNNTGIPLRYKVKLKSETSEYRVNDGARGTHDLNTTKPQTHSHQEHKLNKEESSGSSFYTPRLQEGPIMLPATSYSMKMAVWPEGQMGTFAPAMQEFEDPIFVEPPEYICKDKQWSKAITLNVNTSGDVQSGKLYFAFAVNSGTGKFARTRIVTIMPRYIVVNNCSSPIQFLAIRSNKKRVNLRSSIAGSDSETPSIVSEKADEVDVVAKDEHGKLEFETDADSNEARQRLEGNEGETLDDQQTANLPPQHSNPEHSDKVLNIAQAPNLRSPPERVSLMSRQVGKKFVPELEAKSDSSEALPSPKAGQHNSPSKCDYETDQLTVVTLRPKQAASVYFFSENKLSSAGQMFGWLTNDSRCLINAASVPALSIQMMGKDFQVKNFLKLQLVEASNLCRPDHATVFDPFCKICWNGEKVGTTNKGKRNCPKWGDDFTLRLPLDDLFTAELRIEVWDEDTALGQKIVTAKEILDNRNGIQVEYELEPFGARRFTPPGQKLTIKMQLVHEDEDRWSSPCRIDTVSTENVTSIDVNGRIIPLALGVFAQGPTLIATVRDFRSKGVQPAFCIENRVPDMMLRYRQYNSTRFGRRALRPSEWANLGWDDPMAPKVVEVCTVDCDGREGPPYRYSIESVGNLEPLKIDKSQRCTRVQLYVRVYISGITRTLSVSTIPIHEEPASSILSSMSVAQCEVDMRWRGVSISIIDDTPAEICSVAVEGLRVFSAFQSLKWSVSIMHMQIDNLSPKAKYPVIVMPVDSGLNSQLNDLFIETEEPIPFLHIQFEPDSNAAMHNNAMAVKYLEIWLQTLHLNVDVEFLVSLVRTLTRIRVFESIKGARQTIEKQISDARLLNVRSTRQQLETRLTPPQQFNPFMVVFFRELHLHDASASFHVSIAVDIKDLDPREFNNWAEYKTMQVLATMSNAMTTFSPQFKFHELIYKNMFAPLWVMLQKLGMYYGSQAALQLYKLFGSADVIGDPVGLIEGMGESVVQFFRKTGQEISGKRPMRFEGVKVLFQGVVGKTFGHAAKVTGSVGEMVAGVTGADFGVRTSAPAHIGEGLVQGLEVMGKNLASGVTGLVTKPMEGAQEGGALGAAKGVVKGVRGLAVAPVLAGLGLVTKVAQSIDATTHVFDHDRVRGRRRPARPLYFTSVLQDLSKTVVLREFKFTIHEVDLGPGLASIIEGKRIYVRVKFGRQKLDGPLEVVRGQVVFSKPSTSAESASSSSISSARHSASCTFTFHCDHDEDLVLAMYTKLQIKIKLHFRAKKDKTLARLELSPLAIVPLLKCVSSYSEEGNLLLSSLQDSKVEPVVGTEVKSPELVPLALDENSRNLEESHPDEILSDTASSIDTSSFIGDREHLDSDEENDLQLALGDSQRDRLYSFLPDSAFGLETGQSVHVVSGNMLYMTASETAINMMQTHVQESGANPSNATKARRRSWLKGSHPSDVSDVSESNSYDTPRSGPFWTQKESTGAGAGGLVTAERLGAAGAGAAGGTGAGPTLVVSGVYTNLMDDFHQFQAYSADWNIG